MAATQANSEIAIDTPLGADILLLQRLNVFEELGRLPAIKVDLLSTQDIDFDKILGQKVDVRVGFPGSERYFNGYVSSISQDSQQGVYAHYHATIHPWLWFLTRSSDCRIFQNQTVPEIIKQVCAEFGFTDIKDNLKSEYPYRIWEYCVQYRETNFNFLSRLMEQEGIFYYFTHEKGKHTLNLADCYSSLSTIPGHQEIKFNPQIVVGASKDACIYNWLITKEVHSGVYALNGYDSLRPKMDENVESSIIQKHDKADYELYDFPGEYVEPDDGTNYAKLRIEEQQARYEQLQGQSNVRGLLLGGLFSLTEYPRKDQNRQYLVVSASHSIYTNDYTASDGSGSVPYSNSFTVIDSSTPFRSARVTPKPIVQGPQTALVVGPSGEDIYPDKHARIKVQFFWDRHGKADENSSCWVRVSQNRAGKGWGEVYIPHVGQEVIVSFLEGDPDNPIVTGRVYNGDNKPPIELPAHKTQLAMRDHGGNEIVMEGAAGGQQMRLFSPTHNTTMTLGNSLNVTTDSLANWIIGADWIEDVGGDYTDTIHGNKLTIVDGGQDTTIMGSKMERIVAGERKNVFSGKVEQILGGEVKVVGPSKNELIAGLGVKVHYGHELKRSPSSTELNAAEKNRKSAKENVAIGKVLRKYGIVEETVNAIHSNFNTLDQKIGTLKQKTSELNMKSGDIRVLSDGMFMLKGPTLEVDANLEAKKDVDVLGNLYVKGRKVKLC